MKLRNLTTILLLALTSFFTGTKSGDAAFYPETRVRAQNFQTANFVRAIDPLVFDSHQVKQQFSYELTVDCLVAPKNTKVLKNVPDGVCFVAGTLVLTSNGYAAIEDIEVGQRVITVRESEFQDSSTAVDPDTWRLVKLLMPNPDGSEDIIELSCLRPLAWISEAGVQHDVEIDFVLHEMGIEGTAKVISIAPCPQIEEGEGRVVLSTVTHLNGHLMEIRFDGTEQSLQPTDTHQFYSEDRKAWIPAGRLSIGERLRTADGSTEITSISKQSGIHQVFNIEVEEEHWYYVSELDVLTHNMCARDPNIPVIKQLAGKGQLSALRRNPNLKGVDVDSLLQRTPAELQKMVQQGDLNKRTVRQIFKAFEGRNLRKGQ